MKKSILILVLALALALPGAVLTNAAADNDTFVFASYGDVKDWDPAIAFSLEVFMLRQVYEGLTVYNTPGEEPLILPGLATSWSTSDDGLTWTFNLRKGVKFHDGEPFNAEAAKASIDAARDSEGRAGAWWIWPGIESIETSGRRRFGVFVVLRRFDDTR